MKRVQRRVFVEATFLYQGKIKTGVPRVLHHLINHGVVHAGDFGMEVTPVEIRNGRLYPKSLEACNCFPVPRPPLWKRLVNRCGRMFRGAIVPGDGDVLLMVEHWNGIRHMQALKRFKARSGRVVYIIHDLIPIRRPEFCGDQVISDFTRWFGETTKYADGYMAVSKTVMEDVRAYLAERSQEAPGCFLDHFRLGAAAIDTAARPEEYPELERLFGAGKPVYLTVSTIEPRKNHRYLLDTFDRLWERDIDAVLLIVGQIGWQVESLIDEIRAHPEFGRRLVMMNAVDDGGLALCYREAKALLFASHTEGFGLPIVESLRAGLPVLASDTPVHREVGEAAVEYFDIGDPAALAGRIEAIERYGNTLRNLREYPVHITTWDESVRELFAKLSKHLEG